MATKRKKVWFGYLEAGGKASPVVRDAELLTGDPKTLYLFNFMKGKILEYRRDIVEVKLRELAAEELAMIPEIRKAYKIVRESFSPRQTRSHRPVFRAKPAPIDDEIPDFDDVDDDGFDMDLTLPLDAGDDGLSADQID